MQNLTVIENELVPVYETSTGEKVVYGSELHEVLGVRTPYKDWSSRRLSDVDAIENEDFEKGINAIYNSFSDEYLDDVPIKSIAAN